MDLSWSCDSHAQLCRWHITESRDLLAQMYNQSWGDFVDVQTMQTGSKHKLAARNLIAEKFPNHQLEFSVHGKPLLFPATAYINHSHAGDYAVFIHHPSMWVGIDIEQQRPQLSRIFPRFCNEYELQWLGKNPSPEQLLLIWCAKEALYKAIGQKGTDFRTHLQIEPMENPENQGQLRAQISLPNFEQTIQLPFLQWDDYACVWAVLPIPSPEN